MRDSDTYLAILEEGALIQAKWNILLVGEELFGPADELVKTRLNAVTDLNRLEGILRRALKATGWEEILTAL